MDEYAPNCVLRLYRMKREWEPVQVNGSVVIVASYLDHPSLAAAWVTRRRLADNGFEFTAHAIWLEDVLDETCTIPRLLYREIVRAEHEMCIDRIYIDREFLYIRDHRFLSDCTMHAHPCNWQRFSRPFS